MRTYLTFCNFQIPRSTFSNSDVVASCADLFKETKPTTYAVSLVFVKKPSTVLDVMFFVEAYMQLQPKEAIFICLESPSTKLRESTNSNLGLPNTPLSERRFCPTPLWRNIHPGAAQEEQELYRP